MDILLGIVWGPTPGCSILARSCQRPTARGRSQVGRTKCARRVCATLRSSTIETPTIENSPHLFYPLWVSVRHPWGRLCQDRSKTSLWTLPAVALPIHTKGRGWKFRSRFALAFDAPRIW